jgi:hypothetical protein
MATGRDEVRGVPWRLVPGERVARVRLHADFGGRGQGGIGPSARTPNVFVFTDPVAGERHGYFDGWRDDGYFHYTGEGQRGDQAMMGGNAAVLNHARDKRALRLFMGARGTVRYVGEFEVDRRQPYYMSDAPETNNGPIRSVIVFRLRPMDIAAAPSSSGLDQLLARRVEAVPVEQQWTEQMFVEPSREPYEAERREQKLVLAFQDYLDRPAHDVVRLKIVPEGEAKPLFCDLIDRSTNTLYEAKGTIERGAIRMAIGQLLDYQRFVEPRPRLAVLLPAEPRKDLQDLLHEAGVTIVWAAGSEFVFAEAA